MKGTFNTLIIAGAMVLWAGVANATTDAKDMLVKFTDTAALNRYALSAQTGGAKIESLGGGNWIRVRFPSQQFRNLSVRDLGLNPNVEHVQPNYKLHLLENYKVTDAATRARIQRLSQEDRAGTPSVPKEDNPEMPMHGPNSSGADPLVGKQWGMIDIGTILGWKSGQGAGVVVAVIDTGVDYQHEDLIDNLWRNPGEMGRDAQGNDKSNNKIDDDGNGFIDDVIGWDFASNDNKPYDLAVDPLQLLMGGGNPGHGTHCMGNIAAVANNGIGVAGVAPQAKVMALRFLTEKGEGDTANAIKAINYAVKMGAKVLSNSWGSEGDDPADAANNQALKDAITNAMNNGVLFIAAAGNGHSGVGYDNDSDAKPGVPASYQIENIISVAAIDNTNALGSFSNWGKKSVHIAAPGVAVFSTTVGSNYSDTVIDMYGIKATWDGTSMATPHVAGAAALYWSKHPTATWREVKDALLSSVKPLPALQGKIVSGGKLSVEQLMMH
jgi:thermitase